MPSPTTALRRLRRAYGPLKPPPRRPPVDELVLTILSQNTSDTNRDRAWESMRARFATWDDVADAPVAALLDSIRVGGLAPTKAPRIQAVLRAIRRDRGRIDLGFLRRLDDDSVRAYLCALPGVGLKTASCVLAFSLRRPALPVDTHVHRVGRRLGWIGPRVGAGAAHAVLEDMTPPDARLELHMALVTHGRRTCSARAPRCDSCALSRECPRVGVVR